MDKKKLLYILLTILTLAAFYRVFTAPEEKRVPLKYKTGAKTSLESGVRGMPPSVSIGGQEFKTGKEDIPRVELSKLTSIKIKPPSNGVNLFYPFFIKEPPPPPKPVVTLPPPVDPLEEELKLFRFMGFLEKGKDKEIFLAKGQNTYIVKSGDVIEEKFRVKVVQGVIEVSAINSEKKITIPIEEK